MQNSNTLYLKDGNYKINQQNSEMCLGKGSFGKVYKAFDTVRNFWVAIKVINIEIFQQFDNELKEIILNEINVMRKFSKKIDAFPCQYLVKLYDCFRSDKFVYIVMEFCQHGTLFDEWKTKLNYSEGEVISIVHQLLEGLSYLEQMNIAHRDLKPQNIFIALNESEQKVYKIGDFGFAKKRQSFDDVLGTYQYMAPEIFKREEYTNKVDVWSLGITAHQLLFHQFFYSGKNKWEIQDKIKAIDYQLTEQQNNSISDSMKSFLKACLIKNKFQRPSASQLLAYSLFRSLPNKKSVFDILETLIKKCQNLLQMAESFSNYQFSCSSQKKTIFVQIYLLKFSICQMNRMVYSISNKQNYISISNQTFQELVSKCRQQKYQRINQISQEVWKKAAIAFQKKYEQFLTIYLPKFSLHDQRLIQSVINDQPYEEPAMQIFVNELKKWATDFKKQINLSSEFVRLQQECQKIVQSFEKNC